METAHKPSALDSILKIFGLSNTPTLPTSEEEVAADVDEPPDHFPELIKQNSYAKSRRPANNVRRESLLTQAITGGTKSSELPRQIPTRALSTTSSQSIPSTAELTSDGDLTSPVRSVSPSPPSPTVQFPSHVFPLGKHAKADKVVIAPVTKDDKPIVADVGEAAVEKSLGRKRCIMFACADTPVEQPKEQPAAVTPKEEEKVEPAPQKCRLTFACPTRTDSTVGAASTRSSQAGRSSTAPSPVPSRTTSVEILKPSTAIPTVPTIPEDPAPASLTHQTSFHEFGKSQDETDAWVDQPAPARPKLTLNDCMKKENAIRKIAKEAEDEADAEILEEQEMEDEAEEDQDVVDDFAPSDDDASDGGNESDDENGFADSDDESDDGSEYQFWAPSTTTVATSVDNITHFSVRQRSRGSSVSSDQSHAAQSQSKRLLGRGKASKAIRMRPGTPELPDSTDFVCGTLDEDRPLEAAYISCREQRKREKHIPIPQDIDPSFPTSDPEDNEEDDDDDEFSEPAWLREQFGVMDEEHRGRRASAIKVSADHTPVVVRPEPVRPHINARKSTNRSPPPPRHRSPAPPKHRSPPARKLFGRSPIRMHSPPPPSQRRLNSPRGSPTNTGVPLGITITRLAQRPSNNRTASLPFTPNPFFRNWQMGSPATSRIPSGAVTPGLDHEESRPDLHIRGPVDIVIGLEKKRQKRKEKFWRQHCRKAAKEQAERKCAPGRGVERMKELGLECAERTRGYGLGQQAQLVLSL